MTTEMNVYDLIADYFRFVYKWDENDKKETSPSEYLDEDFKFSAGNNWESGFDFVEWLLAESLDMKNHYKVQPKVDCLNKLLTFKETCAISSRIIKYYEDNYDDATAFTKEITCESLLRHLVYIELAESQVGDLWDILGETESPPAEEEKDEKYICECCGEYNEKEVGIATGFNDVEMRVCNLCDTDGYNYNGWGGYYEDTEDEE